MTSVPLTDWPPAAPNRGMAVGSSRYLAYLPAVFQEGGKLIDGLLKAFEQILSGCGDLTEPGIEERLDGIVAGGETILAGSERYFIPGPKLPNEHRAPEEFLDWLAGWVALTVREDWTADEKRRLIATVAGLYPLRGTKRGLREVLKAYLGYENVSVQNEETIAIDEPDGTSSYFTVRIRLNLGVADRLALERIEEITRALIDQEKPAHTYYALSFTGVQTMKITSSRETTVQIGHTSLLGSI